eukprot:CFRG3477T1
MANTSTPAIVVAGVTALSTFIVVRVYDNYVAPYVFSRHLRTKTLTLNEPCVLDASPATSGLYRMGGMAILLESVNDSGLPPYIVEYVRCEMYARGVVKAFLMREELINYKKVMQHMQNRGELLEMELRQVLGLFHKDRGSNGTEEEVKRSIYLHQQLCLLRGCLHIIRDVRKFTKKICTIPRHPTSEHKRMFIAGDDCVWHMPDHFNTDFMMNHFQSVVDTNKERMRAQIKIEGWPPISCTAEGKNHTCKVCKKVFGKAWVHAKVCWKCQDDFRSERRCPFEKFNPKTVCPHARRCFSCERHSCVQCRVTRGSGIDVEYYVHENQPTNVFLDFDQTLASTKGGNSPRLNKHGVDVFLRKVLLTHPNVCIVTKQNIGNEADIRLFLAAAGADNVDLVCLGKNKNKWSKADVIAHRMKQFGSSATALYVDDMVREVCDPGICAMENVYRILFSSNDYKPVTREYC